MAKKKKEVEKTASGGMSRRGFFSSVSAGAAAVAVVGGAAIAREKVEVAESETIKLKLSINGRKHKVHVEPRFTLLYVIRDMLGLVGTKVGCERGECGACSVLIDGKAQYACMTLAVEAEGHEITTLEGLMDGENLGTVQQAFVEEDAFQCGFCTPGQIIAVEDLLRRNADPSVEEIRVGVSGNLCRCGAYKHIFNAALNAAEKRKAGGGAQ